MKRQQHTTDPAFQVLHRVHRFVVRTELARAGLDDLGSPAMLISLKQQFSGEERPSQRQLAQVLSVTPATVAMTLKSLQRCGYIEKYPDPRDQRCKRIGMTEKGLAAVKVCEEIFFQANERVFEGFTPEENAQVEGYHQRMLDNINSYAEEIAQREGKR